VQKAYRKINKLPDFEQKNGGGSTLISSSYVEEYVPTVMSGTGPSAFDHFKDEVKNQVRDLTWQKRPPK
jgi:hypothetical protein